MNRIADFLVTRRRAVLTVMLVLMVICALMALRVPINRDRTKYLADSSNMKQGLSIMNDAFPEAEEKASIRVMFDDLTAADIIELRARLEAIPYVSSVSYQEDSADYNRDNHTLFVVNSTYDYTTDEEDEIERTIAREFSGYTMEYQNNDIPTTEVPFWLIMTALSMAVLILVLMSHSWLDPLLFLVTIGIAMVINYGTNIILPYTDEMTATVGPVLQLTLSMDYSIILMNRFRQEKLTHGDNLSAMKAALAGSVSSIASSSLTTVVGLLALVFLSFKLGPELGIVLSKGVFISMICVLTVLPCLILSFDKWLEKTRKPSLRIPMGGLSAFSYRLRRAMPAIFLVLLVGSYLWQSKTDIVFTEGTEDRVADVFQKENNMVVIYRNEDEEKTGAIIEALEQDPMVTSVLGYSNTLNKRMDAEEMGEAIGELSSDGRISKDMVRMLYFVYGDKELPTISTADFLRFITDTVLNSVTLSEYIDDGIRDNMAELVKFSDAKTLTKKMTTGELAKFFGIDEAKVRDLCLYYFIQNGVADSGTMTLPEFTDYVLNEVAGSGIYGAMFDADTLASLRKMQACTDTENLQQERTPAQLASLLGMEESTAATVYRLYYAGDVSGKTMTVADFSAFLCNDLMQNALFSSYFDEATAAQVQQLNTLIGYAVSGQSLSAGEMGQLLGMDESSVAGLYYLYYAEDPAFQEECAAMRMSLPDFLTLMQENAPASDKVKLALLEPLITAAATGRKLANGTASVITGITEGIAGTLFGLDPDEVTTLPEFLAAALESVPGDVGLQRQNTIVTLAASGEAVDAATLAELFEIETEQVYQLFGLSLAGQKTMPLPAFTGFLVSSVLTDETYAGSFSSEQANQLRQMDSIVQTAAAGTPMDASALAQTFGMDESMIVTVFRLYYGGDVSGKTMSLQAFIDYLLGDTLMTGSMDAETLGQLQLLRSVIDASVKGTAFSSGALASLLGMDPTQAEQLYILRMSKTAQWTLSPRDFVAFAEEKVLGDASLGNLVDKESAADLRRGYTLIEAVVSGKQYTSRAMLRLLSSLTEDINEDEVELLYLFYGGTHSTDTGTRMTIPELFDYLSDELVRDERFADFFDEETRAQIEDGEAEILDAIAQLKGESYSRLILTSDYADESPETQVYINRVQSLCEDSFDEYYMVGNSVMVSEMRDSFSREYIMITLITAVAIFLVVLLTFRDLAFPLILTLIVQCGVFITVIVIGAYSGSIYYLALLIVQSILMGATIDYGIVFCSFYREYRLTMESREALRSAYEGSIHTILTSGSILVLVLAALGLFSSSTMISDVCVTLSIGALVAILLILFVLPGMVCCFDRIIHRRRA